MGIFDWIYNKTSEIVLSRRAERENLDARNQYKQAVFAYAYATLVGKLKSRRPPGLPPKARKIEIAEDGSVTMAWAEDFVIEPFEIEDLADGYSDTAIRSPFWHKQLVEAFSELDRSQYPNND